MAVLLRVVVQLSLWGCNGVNSLNDKKVQSSTLDRVNDWTSLKQGSGLLMFWCETNSILSEYEVGINLHPLKCKRWSCLVCNPLRQARLKREAHRGKPNTFITLTVCPSEHTTPEARARDLVSAWRKVRRRAKRGWGNKKIPFIAIFEETQKGEPHLHILARTKWIPQNWLSEEMQREIGAPVVDIKRINSVKAASRYVCKYVGKNPRHYGGCKRYWRSLDYLIEPAEERKDPIGEAKRKWFERGLPEEIAGRNKYAAYELLE